MKKLVQILGIIGLLIGACYLFSCWGKGLAGGGGSGHIVPDKAKTGESTQVGLIVNAWGRGGPIHGRFADISLHYKLVGENTYKSVRPIHAALPENYQKAITKLQQYEKYEFTIPPYAKGTSGQIEYYIDMTFDGYPSHTEGIKKIPLDEN